MGGAVHLVRQCIVLALYGSVIGGLVHLYACIWLADGVGYSLDGVPVYFTKIFDLWLALVIS